MADILKQNVHPARGRGLRALTTWRRLSGWAARINLERKVALVFLVGAALAGSATLAAMTGNLPLAMDPLAMLLILYLDLILLLGIGALIARRLVILWVARRQGVAGARLHARVVGLFSLVAVLPTIIVALFSALFFNFGLQGWFSDRVNTAVQESLAVAEAYLEEHRQTIGADVLAMAHDLNREGPMLRFNPQRLSETLSAQAALRSLTEAVVFDDSGRIVARAGFSLLLDFDPHVPEWALRRAREGEAVILTAQTEDRVRALVRLEGLGDTYLFVGRLVDPKVLQHMDRTRGAVQLYENLEGRRGELQLVFGMIFIMVSLLLLAAAVWVGLSFANHLTRPIGQLILATERVRTGDLTARAPTRHTNDELESLIQAFNRMTGQLESQQGALVDANRQLDERRRFTEAVLAGVSAGVIGLDREGRIDLPNRSACELLQRDKDDLVGRALIEIAPQMAEPLELARRRPTRISESQVPLPHADGSTRMLLVRVAAEMHRGKIGGFVVTFDDITELLAAQRKAAWADVARRIAHEIKNPLTPIQLSAERLKRKYLKEVSSDPRTFEVCTDTIVRHVGEIGRMVDEFSSFARMPPPVMAEEDLRGLVEQSIFLQESAHQDLRYLREVPEEPSIIRCDERQVSRALINLLQNAADSIAGRKVGAESLPKGEIFVRLVEERTNWVVEVVDNGRGLPKEARERLTEPYVTTRERGTGLGLAIVKKIMEDHGGALELSDRRDGAPGAMARLVFPQGAEALYAGQATA